MAALLVGLSVMAVLMGVALPVWNKQAQREREEEYLFRAHEYARGILKFQRKAGPGTLPPTLDFLVEQRFVRRKYKDPLNGQDFQAVYQSAAPIGGSGGAVGQIGTAPPGGTGTGGGTPPSGFGGTSTQQTGGTSTTGQTAAMPGAPVIGVVSKSKATSIKIWNGRTRYDQWAVTYQDVRPGKGLPPDILQSINQTGAQPGQAGAAGGFGQPATGGQNPFGQPGGSGNPFAQPGGTGNPFAQPGGGSPFGQPAGPPGANPFGAPGTNPFQGGGSVFTPSMPPPPGQTGASPFGAPPPKKQ
jgi:type II secretory pathway pseudopilin PulG